MGYEFRNVKCPWCDHVFMWNKTGDSWPLYRLKESKKYVGSAKCPKCGSKIVVLDHILEGIDTDDDRIEPSGITRCFY